MKKTEMAPKTLTDLPETIIDDILCLLPIADAVRTSILTRSWRHRWKSIPDLDLAGIPEPIASHILLLHSGNICFFRASHIDHDIDSSIYCWIAALSARAGGSTLQTLHLYDFTCHLHTIARHFPHLTHLLLDGGSQYLDPIFSGYEFKSLKTLHLQSITFYGPLSMLFSGFPLLEEASLLNIDLEQRQRLDIFAPNLRSLELVSMENLDGVAVTNDGDLFGLRKLQTLQLKYVPFHGNLTMLFSACSLLETVTLMLVDSEESLSLDILGPNLQNLSLIGMGAITSFRDFSGLKNLQILFLHDVIINVHLAMLFSACPLLWHATLISICLEKRQCLDIVAPNLRMLTLVCVKYLDEFVISSAPVLEEAVLLHFVKGDDRGRSSGDCKVMKVLGGMLNIKKLKLFNLMLKCLMDSNIPGRLPVSFNHLKLISLDVDFACVSQLSLTLCLLRSSPNLLELECKCETYNSEVVGVGPNFWEAQEHLGVSNKLETVKMFNIMGVKAELGFLQFVLGKAKLLKKMMVGFSPVVTNGKPIMSELSEFPMISNQAQILFMCKIFVNA